MTNSAVGSVVWMMSRDPAIWLNLTQWILCGEELIGHDGINILQGPIFSVGNDFFIG